MSLRTRFRALSPAARLLVVNQFGVNVGFYMVVPYLATYLADDLGYAAALVGLVLGLRVLAQQGLFLVGGTAADRIGCRPVIVLGCALRVVAFGLFALTTSPAGVVAAAVLTGMAGALFNPAVRAYLTKEAGPDRAGVFAVFNTAADAGAFAGPLLGAALLLVDFRLVCAVACVVFALLTVAQLFVLPHREVDVHTDTVLGSWATVVRNRRFLAFTLCGSAYFALYNQLYLVLPLEAQRVTGTPVAIGALFAVSTVLGILLYVRIADWGTKRLSAGACVALGLAAMGLGFAPVAASALLLPTATAFTPLGIVGVLAGTVLFTLGIALANPFTMQLLPVVGSERLAGTYYGFFYLVSALVAAGVATAVGGLLDAGAAGRTAASLALLALGLAGAAGTAVLQRRGLLAARDA